MIGYGDSMEIEKRLPRALNRCIVFPVQTETRQREGATKRKGAIMFVTIDRAAIESAICNEYPESKRNGWYTAACRYGVLAVSESWDDVQDAVMEYAECGAKDDSDVECAFAECAIRPATDSEVIDALVERELDYIAMSTRCLLASSIDELRQAVIDELVELGYQNSFIRFDSCDHYCRYYDGDMMFDVTPQF